jgi:hypothetical protein
MALSLVFVSPLASDGPVREVATVGASGSSSGLALGGLASEVALGDRAVSALGDRRDLETLRSHRHAIAAFATSSDEALLVLPSA